PRWRRDTPPRTITRLPSPAIRTSCSRSSRAPPTRWAETRSCSMARKITAGPAMTVSANPKGAAPRGLAFGVDPSRPERYSLRQSRYAALAENISGWAGAAARRGETLSLLDVGCGWGPLLRHLDTKPHFNNIAMSAA